MIKSESGSEEEREGKEKLDRERDLERSEHKTRRRAPTHQLALPEQFLVLLHRQPLHFSLELQGIKLYSFGRDEDLMAESRDVDDAKEALSFVGRGQERWEEDGSEEVRTENVGTPLGFNSLGGWFVGRGSHDLEGNEGGEEGGEKGNATRGEHANDERKGTNASVVDEDVEVRFESA